MQISVVGFYAIDRCYGGPEEGGWWYDSGELVRLHRLFLSEDAATRAAARANRLLDLVQRGHAQVGSVLYIGLATAPASLRGIRRGISRKNGRNTNDGRFCAQARARGRGGGSGLVNQQGDPR